MARKKLGLVNFMQGEGPWIRATGFEREVKVTTLKDGEQVGLEVEGQIGSVHCLAGLTPVHLHEGWMYRFVKQVREGVRPSKTCVEVMLNGS